jgi:hypothetical protein
VNAAELRGFVFDRARGLCEYCLLPDSEATQPHQLDHIIARQHGGGDDEGNLALCCVVCNRYKGTNLTSLDPETKQLTPLFNPRHQHWQEHFLLEQGRILGLTPAGRATAFILRLNDEWRVLLRQTLEREGRSH